MGDERSGGRGPVERVPERLLRIGDADREQLAAALSEHFVAGRLDYAEFDARLTAAYAARTRADADAIFADLPGPKPLRAKPLPRATTPPQRRGVNPGWVMALPLVMFLFALITVRTGFPPFFLLPLVWVWFGAAHRAWR
jgi:hypothetical protein